MQVFPSLGLALVIKRLVGSPPGAARKSDALSVRIASEPADGRLWLSWQPVALDREGRAEWVARYHVYRYVEGPPYPVVRAFRIGSTPEHAWIDDEPPAGPGLVLYRVSAEDEAGNEALRRD